MGSFPLKDPKPDFEALESVLLGRAEPKRVHFVEEFADVGDLFHFLFLGIDPRLTEEHAPPTKNTLYLDASLFHDLAGLDPLIIRKIENKSFTGPMIGQQLSHLVTLLPPKG